MIPIAALQNIVKTSTRINGVNAFFSVPEIISSTKGPATFGNIQDAASWLVSNQALDQSAANSFMSRAQFSMKSKTKGFHFNMGSETGLKSRSAGLVCNVVSATQVDGGISVFVGSVSATTKFWQVRRLPPFIQMMPTFVMGVFVPLNSNEIGLVYDMLLTNASNAINNIANSL